MSAALHVIGLDLGTSGVKAVLVAADGTVRAEASAPLQVSRPHPLWSEQTPAQWLAAVDTAVGALRRQASPAHWAGVRALAAAGQMHGAVLLDDQGQVLRPAILWNDGRSQAQCAQLEQRVPALRTLAANRAMAGFTAPKLLWLAEHEPELFGRIATVLLPKDWLVWQLTGVLASECSDASGTLWLDVASRRWHPALVAACGLGLAQLPKLCESAETVGLLAPAWCRAWGLPEPVQVAAGAGDNAAGALGVGVVSPQDGLVSLGTSGVIFVPTHEVRPHPERGVHTFCHALPGLWHQMSVMLSAAGALAWWSRIAGAEPGQLLADLAVGSVRPRAPLFLPYLSGERTPHADPGATAGFIGLEESHDRSDLSYAVIEGVCFGLADGLAALREAGTSPERLLAVGGGARSPAWLQLLADLLGLPVECADGAEVGPALGAARLALMSQQLPLDQVLRRPSASRRFEPDAQRAALLHARWQRFRAAWQPLRSLNPA